MYNLDQFTHKQIKVRNPIINSYVNYNTYEGLLFKVALYKDFVPPIFHLKTAVTFLILHQN